MPGFTFLTTLPAPATETAAVQAARALGFALVHTGPCQFQARKGTLLRSLMLPPSKPYCRFLITMIAESETATKVIMEQNDPWWLGSTGYDFVSLQFDDLIDAIADNIKKAGGKII